MVNKRIPIVFILIILLIPLVTAAEDNKPMISNTDAIKLNITSTVTGQEQDCLYYFFGKDCVECSETDTFLKQLQVKHPLIKINKYEVYQDAQNAAVLENYYSSYNVPKSSRQIPVIFMLDSYFIGKESIQDLLEGRIKENEDNNCPSMESSEVFGVIGTGSPSNVLDTLTFLKVTGHAIRDSFSAAHLALILIFLAILITIKKDHVMIQRGVLFIASVYVVHFLFGTGLFTGLLNTKANVFFYKTVGIIAVIYGLISIKSFFKTWKVLIDSIPKEVMKNMKTFKNALLSVTAVFLGGFLGGMLSLPDLGVTYVLLQNLFGESIFRVAALPLLLYYALLIVLPLILLLVAVHVIRINLVQHAASKGKYHERKEKLWRNHNYKVMHFVVSVVMLIVGLVLIFV